MNTKQRNVIIVSLIIIAVAVLALFYHFFQKVSFYDDESTTGNTSCNLLNGGLFCESDDTIYFANPYDENMLYSMSSDLGNVRQISGDNVSYLNIAGKYIFYTKRNDKKQMDSDAFLSLSATGLYRTTKNGKNLARLYEDPTQAVCLYGNQLYYQHYNREQGLLLYSIKIDGSSDKMLLEEACAPGAIDNNTIYYTGIKEDHAIHSLQTDGSGKQTLYNGNCTSLSKQGDYLYFLDMEQDYSLKRISVNGGSPETLISDHVATYNVSPAEDIIYCQIDNGTDANGLYQYDIAANSLQRLASGNYNYLHLTSDYLFYETYDQSKLYVLDLATNTSEEFIPKAD
ncbi:MAG: DUF5050 domain-containing protein [Butyribacter sp.]|nr:DUF5050 domain-containing protein [bacterium]MDY3854910.1 DUF5050 domain-containing protein [Butyribacter sp.]